jgi:hypothetical protein
MDIRCLLDDCEGISVNGTRSPKVPSGGGIIGVFMSIVSVSVIEAIVKLDAGIIVNII